jgi:peptidyl-tRNA hydrolase, PTH1 family
MSLFQSKPQESDPVNYVTIGMNKTLLLVGLGNPGKEYEGTRHNIGFACIDAFARSNDFPAWIEKKDLRCQLASKQLADTRIIIIKPTTFMNLSGEAVQAVCSFYKIDVNKITAIYDELDVDFGQIRLRVGGSAAGHNGVKSIIQHLGEDFGRIRVGIGPKDPPQIDSADFVLQRFSADQQANLKELLVEATAVLSETAYGSPLPNETRSFLL